MISGNSLKNLCPALEHLQNIKRIFLNRLNLVFQQTDIFAYIRIFHLSYRHQQKFGYGIGMDNAIGDGHHGRVDRLDVRILHISRDESQGQRICSGCFPRGCDTKI